MTQNPLVVGLIMVVIFVAGLFLGRMSVSPVVSTGPANTATVSGGTTATSSGTPVTAESLTPAQRQMLASFGIDPNTITITPQMIACAEASLGASRIEEIKQGATPSFGEGMKLVACYK